MPGDIVIERPGSDFMVDVIKTLDIDYVATNPGSSFRGLHESLINYGGNKKPELLTCMHEEAAVAMAHGYAKVAGKPMGVLVHGTVGLQHAAMAVYNAWCRPRADHDVRRQRPRRDQAPAGHRVEPLGAGRGARWCATS